MGRVSRISRAVIGILVGLLALVVTVALAATGGLHSRGCFADDGAHSCFSPPHDSIGHMVGVAVSADGTSLYATSFDHGAITTFGRRSDGALTYAGCVANGGEGGCDSPAHDSLAESISVAVSPDGTSVYVANESEPFGGLTIFHRAPDGDLTYGGCFADNRAYGCQKPGSGSLDAAESVAVSPDGKSVYVAASFESGISVFDRGPDGSLTFASCFSSERRRHCEGAPHHSIDDPYGLAISPDGRSVYVGSLSNSSVTNFTRLPDGSLTFKECFANGGQHGCRKPGHPSLESSIALAVSPNGGSLYVASESSVTRFKRRKSGALYFGQCLAERTPYLKPHGCREVPHKSLEAGDAIAVSPDGRSIYTGGLSGPSLNGGPGAINHFEHEPGNGLTYRGCYVSDGLHGCRSLPHFAPINAEGLAISPDGASLYAAADGSLAIFRRTQSVHRPRAVGLEGEHGAVPWDSPSRAPVGTHRDPRPPAWRGTPDDRDSAEAVHDHCRTVPADIRDWPALLLQARPAPPGTTGQQDVPRSLVPEQRG